MKRLLVGLLVVGMLVVGGAAFAADTSVVVPPRETEYNVTGAVSVSVEGLGDLLSALSGKGGVLDELERDLNAKITGSAPGVNVVVAWVSFVFNVPGPSAAAVAASDSSVNYTLASNEELYNFEGGAFERPASNPYTFVNEDDKYLDGSIEPGKMSFVSVRTSDSGGGSSSGGCSVWTLGAVVLFLLPAFAMVKRGRK